MSIALESSLKMMNEEMKEQEKENQVKEPEKKELPKQTEKKEESEEVNIVKACEVGRDWMKKFVGNLNLHNFRIEQVKKNGSENKYLVVMSVIADLGEEKEYFLVKVDIITGKIVFPIGKGKMINGEITFTKFDIPEELEK